MSIGELKRGDWISYKNMIVKVSRHDPKNIRGIDYAHDDEGVFRKVIIPAGQEARKMTQMEVLEWVHKRVESVTEEHRKASQEVARLLLIRKKYLTLRI